MAQDPKDVGHPDDEVDHFALTHSHPVGIRKPQFEWDAADRYDDCINDDEYSSNDESGTHACAEEYTKMLTQLIREDAEVCEKTPIPELLDQRLDALQLVLDKQAEIDAVELHRMHTMAQRRHTQEYIGMISRLVRGNTPGGESSHLQQHIDGT